MPHDFFAAPDSDALPDRPSPDFPLDPALQAAVCVRGIPVVLYVSSLVQTRVQVRIPSERPADPPTGSEFNLESRMHALSSAVAGEVATGLLMATTAIQSRVGTLDVRLDVVHAGISSHQARGLDPAKPYVVGFYDHTGQAWYVCVGAHTTNPDRAVTMSRQTALRILAKTCHENSALGGFMRPADQVRD